MKTDHWLFNLGLILFITGMACLLIISNNIDWYVKNISIGAIVAIHLVLLILMVISGCIMIIAALDQD